MAERCRLCQSRQKPAFRTQENPGKAGFRRLTGFLWAPQECFPQNPPEPPRGGPEMTSFRNEEMAQRAIPAVTYWNLWAPRKEAGESRLRPARKKPAFGRCKPASFWQKKEPASAGSSRLLSVAPKGKPASAEAGFLGQKPASSGQKSRLLAKRSRLSGQKKPASFRGAQRMEEAGESRLTPASFGQSRLTPANACFPSSI